MSPGRSSVRPKIAVSPSIRAQSCSLWYLRFLGFTSAPFSPQSAGRHDSTAFLRRSPGGRRCRSRSPVVYCVGTISTEGGSRVARRKGLVINDEQMQMIDGVLSKLQRVCGSNFCRPDLHQRPAHHHRSHRMSTPTLCRSRRWPPGRSPPLVSWPRSSTSGSSLSCSMRAKNPTCTSCR